MSEVTIAKAKAILDGSARGTDCKDVATAYIAAQRDLDRISVELVKHEATLWDAAGELDLVYENLTQAQVRCNELLEEVRALRAGRSAHVAA